MTILYNFHLSRQCPLLKMLIILEVTILLTILNNFTLLTIRMSQRGLQYSLLQIFNQLFNLLIWYCVCIRFIFKSNVKLL